MAIHLSTGTELNGYTLTTDMTASDAGTSMWAIAEKAGFEYFVKCFLTPVYPSADASGSEATKQRKRARCEAFEQRMSQVKQILDDCGSESFLVRSVDFFRLDGSYYKVTKKLVAKKVGLVKLPAKAQLLILLSAAYGLKTLHENSGFVHADIKPENFMVQRAGERLIANLIDFDAGFFMGHSPSPDDLTGDQRYWSPELIEYLISDSINNNQPIALSQALDIFSLGVTFCEYITGQLPVFSPYYAYVGEAVLSDTPIRISSVRHAQLSPVVPLIEAMLNRNPLNRPSAGEIHDQLRDLNKQLFVTQTTYGKMADALKTSLLDRGASLGDLTLLYGNKALNKRGPNTQIGGLDSESKLSISSLIQRFRKEP